MAIFNYDQMMAIATLVSSIIVGLITVAAIVFSPIVALRLQKAEESDKDIQRNQLNIFKKLMATRAARVSAEHSYALNMIDIEFYDCKKILDTWDIYRKHLNTMAAAPTIEAAHEWLNQGNDLLMNLLKDISAHLNFDFSKEDLNGLFSFSANFLNAAMVAL
jgi:hypothetical protein